ncbi:acetylornithine deacetylase [Ancylobacter sp. WKF20]|uniref:acetylornithine deacetylase n=1 Tax=Ancylobacter sp. WKF20 TaxID=3039801 RepID=UPI002434618B|nr:acetylornithine deacetylase [Ancylobacter sp. WKF20]WGD30253.1 acetylornithine deacetylase [Ancylobacter sp. WKF20]
MSIQAVAATPAAGSPSSADAATFDEATLDAAMLARTVSLLADLVAFPSESARSNLPIVDYIEAYLASEGITARRIPNADGSKASLLATIGPVDRPGVALSAHTDVVPVAGQDWSSDPWTLTERDGRLYGRGSSDMKGFLAVVLAHVPLFRQTATHTPVHLCFSYDEELGCLGAPDLVAEVAALPVPPALCIVGEPTALKVARAHKGKFARRLTITGRGGHSALVNRAANAVEAAAEITVGLGVLGRSLRTETNDTFDPPWTSVHVGSLHGGSALNLVPDRAVMEFEARTLPGTDIDGLNARIALIIDEARARLVAQAPEAGIAMETLSDYPGLDTPEGSPATRLVAALAGDNGAPVTLAFGTEAGLYARAGIPTLVCGPGDIGRAHKADEWIGRDELGAAGTMMTRLAGHLGRPFAST